MGPLVVEQPTARWGGRRPRRRQRDPECRSNTVRRNSAHRPCAIRPDKASVHQQAFERAGGAERENSRLPRSRRCLARVTEQNPHGFGHEGIRPGCGEYHRSQFAAGSRSAPHGYERPGWFGEKHQAKSTDHSIEAVSSHVEVFGRRRDCRNVGQPRSPSSLAPRGATSRLKCHSRRRVPKGQLGEPPAASGFPRRSRGRHARAGFDARHGEQSLRCRLHPGVHRRLPACPTGGGAFPLCTDLRWRHVGFQRDTVYRNQIIMRRRALCLCSAGKASRTSGKRMQSSLTRPETPNPRRSRRSGRWCRRCRR